MDRSRKAMLATTVVLALIGIVSCADAAAQPAPAVATADAPVGHEENDRVPEGAVWTQHYFPSSDGSDTELHADVLLPEGLAEGQRVPVVLAAGPYFGHSGEVQPEGWTHTGPSDRFSDLVLEGGLLERGYALVMVDTRGFGGSTGCLDFAGPGDQADIRAAVDWAASRPWSTGAVGMYGKSYDAITALVGNNLNHDALRAVVAQEPIWDLHRNIWSYGVPRSTVANVSTQYNQIAMLPQLPDDPRYRTNAEYELANPLCTAVNTLNYQIADPENEYWRARDLAANAAGTDTPLLFTQGLLEWNTEAEGMQEFLDNHQGPQRGWLGPWDHWRGNDRAADGRLQMGRAGWFDEVLSFYDEHLKGIEPPVAYPNFAVQDSTGTWRTQDTWPVVERSVTIPVGGGSYVDDGADADLVTPPAAGDSGNSDITWSEPLGDAVRVTGTPRISLNAQGHGNLSVKLYDVAPDGTAVMFDEQAAIVRGGGMSVEFRSTDWVLPAGHHLAVEFGTIRPTPLGDWLDTPSYETVTVTDARLDLALDDPADDTAAPGERAVWLDGYLATYTRPLTVGTPTFTVPTVGS